MVFATARRVTGNYHDAEDVAQSCFLELARRTESMRISVAAYLHSTATRRSVDLLRKHTRRRMHERQAAAEHAEPSDRVNPAERSWDELSPEVDLAIEQLPDELRAAIILFYLRGLTDADIAHELKMSKTKVMRRLKVGVRRLRASLAKDGRTVPLGALVLGLKAGRSMAVPASLTAATGRMALAARLGRPCVSPGWFVWRNAVDALISALLRLGPIGLTALGILTVSVTTTLLYWPAGSKPAGPYDRLNQLYAAYLPNDPVSGFQWHTASIKSDLSSFWRGSQPLFYQWCKTNCRDWLSDPNSYALCNASPNLEDSERLPVEINPDNSARLPVQIELLQGMITVRLASNGGFSKPNDPTAIAVARTLCNTYRASLLGSQPLTGNSAMPPPDGERDDIHNYIDPTTGDFRSIILRRDRIYQFLIPSRITRAQATAMVKSALDRNESLRDFVGSADPQVESIRQQVRYDSVVTQGQAEFLVMLGGSRSSQRIILELKQQTPSSAELAGAVSRDPRLPARRAAENAGTLAISSAPPPISWCILANESFTVTPFAPQGYVFELRKDRWVDPLAAAGIWASNTAATHRADPHRTALAAQITPELPGELVSLCNAYIDAMRHDLEAFCNDPRAAHDRLMEEASINTWLAEARAVSISKVR